MRWRVPAIIAVALLDSSGFARKPAPVPCDKSLPFCLVKVNAEWATLQGPGSVHGLLLNQSTENTDGPIIIEFTLRRKGIIVGTASASTSASLHPGEQWRFDAPLNETYFLVVRATLTATIGGRYIHGDLPNFTPICKASVWERGCPGW